MAAVAAEVAVIHGFITLMAPPDEPSTTCQPTLLLLLFWFRRLGTYSDILYVRLGSPAQSDGDLSVALQKVELRGAMHFFLLPIRILREPSWLFPLARYWLV